MNKFLEQTKKAASAARQASISNLNAASTVLSSASGTSIKLTVAKTDVELKRLLEEEPIIFSGSAWKRRGGLGKLASYSSAWETRHFQLRGCVLMYFDSDPTKALSSSNDPKELLRGYIDFAKENASVQATFGHSGAPSPFCLSIKVPVGLAQETKWKLCFDHHQTQMEWLAVLSDVVIQCSVDLYNKALLDAANQSVHGNSESKMLRRPPVYEPGTKEMHSTTTTKTRTNSFQLVDCPHQLWLMEEYTLERKSNQSEEQKAKTKASVETALQVMERLLSKERNQRAIASKRGDKLEAELEEVKIIKGEISVALEKMTKENRLMAEELSIRVSTYDLDITAQDCDEVVALKTKIEIISKLLAEKEAALEQSKNDKDSAARDLEHELAQLQTNMVILKGEHDEALEKSKHELIQKESETEVVRREMQERIDQLEKEMETAKKEYSESIQALAANFQRSVGVEPTEEVDL